MDAKSAIKYLLNAVEHFDAAQTSYKDFDSYYTSTLSFVRDECRDRPDILEILSRFPKVSEELLTLTKLDSGWRTLLSHTLQPFLAAQAYKKDKAETSFKAKLEEIKLLCEDLLMKLSLK